MRIIFIGDIVGSSGREALQKNLPMIKEKYKPHMIIVNGENAAGGRGITEKIAKEFFSLGIHAITMGNHTWDQKDIFDFIDHYDALIRPANYPTGTPGKGFTLINYNNHKIAIINIQGRTFLPPIDCPFQTVSDILEKIKKETPNIIVDFHAEATSEKIAMGWYLDGRVSAVFGTHTHVQTADERILPNGTGYITDIGMTGPRNGILGMNKDAVINKFITSLPQRFEVDTGEQWQLNAVLIDLDLNSGKTTHIERISLDEKYIQWN